MKCPGQDMRYWKPGDIFSTPCPNCGGSVEFFKDEVHRKCRCGHVVTNPKLDFGCAEWCPYAEQCIGAVPEEVKAKRRMERESSHRERISLEMKKYFGADLKRINHSLKVARYAEQILKIEGGNPLIVLGAAYLHEIGAHEADKKHEEGGGEYYRHQEMEGIPIAREILERLDIEKEERDKICDIIGHRHHPREEETLDFQILYEADWLVIMEEKGISKDRKEIEAKIEKHFRTEAGRKLAEKLYLN